MQYTGEQAVWVTGQLLFVHGGHRMTLGLLRNERGCILSTMRKRGLKKCATPDTEVNRLKT